MPTRLPSPPTLTTPAREQHHLVRERIFGTTDVAEVVAALHESHVTGTLFVDISQGTVGSIRFREEQKVHFDNDSRK